MDKANLKSFDKVINSDLCAGCGLCESVFTIDNVNVGISDKGYYRPSIKKNSERTSNIQLKDFCPALTIRHDESKIKKGNSIWGVYKDILLGNANDQTIRYRGSSGGTISALLIYLLDKKIIDGIIHIGVSDNNPIINEIKYSTTADEILNNSGSRYSPSAPLINIEYYLRQDKKYAFVGKPCDVAALRMYEMQDKRVNEKILYMFSFFCAGVPSLEGTKDILNKFNVSLENIKSFRYRGEGWPGFTTIETKDNKKYTMKYEDSWGKILNKYLQKRCKICIDGIGEFSDIVCADGWDCDEKGYPIFTENDGTSIIISRTSKGEKLLKEVVEKGYIEINKNLEVDQLKFIQPFQFQRRRTLKFRLMAMKSMFKGTPSYSRKVLNYSSEDVNIRTRIKIVLGTLLRVIKGRI